MTDKFENGNNLKRRRCYYKFSKDYPGSRYDKSKKRSTRDELDTKGYIIKRTLFALLLVFLFLLTYFVIYTVIGISNEKVEGLDEIGKTNAYAETAVNKDKQNEMINDLTDKNSEEETTVTQPDESFANEETAVNDILE